MANKILVYAGVGMFFFILIFSILLSAGILNINGKNINFNADLNKYRSENIPEECRIPNYENDVQAWKEHLSHHQNTLYCLDYYK